jgi:hypothetical protein
MEKLNKAMQLVRYYNLMDFDTFADEYENWTGKTVTKEEREEWRFAGLNNVDFLKFH